MKNTRHFLVFAATLGLLLGAITPGVMAQPAQPLPSGDDEEPTAREWMTGQLQPSVECSDFMTKSEDLGDMEALFYGDKDSPIGFDAGKARGLGFSEESIALAKELAAYTHALVFADTVPEQPPPWVKYYFDCATKYHKERERDANQEGDNQVAGWCSEWLTDAACTCGHWGYPRPYDNGSWQTRTPEAGQSPADALRARGYHETSEIMGGGWTRPQTYEPNTCGSNTFRDHGQIQGSNYSVQEYEGVTPPGEPNPEVHKSGPWPYVTWPAYVYWWHETRN